MKTLIESWRRTQDRGLVGSHCQKCLEYSYPAVKICSECFSSDHLISYHFKGPFKVLEVIKSYEETDSHEINSELPCVFCLVDLGHGCRTLGLVESHEEITRGDLVDLRFIRIPIEDSKNPIVYSIGFRKQ